jgi:hypothetical protein
MNDKISVEDSLRLEVSSLRKTVLQLQFQLLEKDEAILFADLRKKYNMQEGDEIDMKTLEIVRKAAVEPAKP